MSKAKKREESIVQAGIRRAIGAEKDFDLFRNNVGEALFGKARVAYGLGTGTPDLVGMLSVWGVAIWVAFEVKAPGEEPSLEQRRVHAAWRARGVFVFVVHSVDEAVAMLEYARGAALAILRESAARDLASALGGAS